MRLMSVTSGTVKLLLELAAQPGGCQTAEAAAELGIRQADAASRLGQLRARGLVWSAPTGRGRAVHWFGSQAEAEQYKRLGPPADARPRHRPAREIDEAVGGGDAPAGALLPVQEGFMDEWRRLRAGGRRA